jgi:L-asparaginase
MIQIFTTGGTIDKVYFDAQSTYQVGEPQITYILREANVTAPHRVTTLLRKDSLDLTDADRALVAEHVRRTEARRVLITHGTDTMARTALRLERDALRAGNDATKTVVLVGSLTPARFQRSDAVFNVGFAMGVVQAMPPGVYLAMNGQVFRPGDVRKNRDANRFERPSDAPASGAAAPGATAPAPRPATPAS